MATNILLGKGYIYSHHNTVYHSFGYPVYPLLCAFFHFITNRNYFILEIFQIILSVTTCYFIYLIAKKIYNEKIGLLSLFLTAAHPGIIIYSTKIHELTLVLFFTAAIFWYIISLDCTKFYTNIFIGSLIGIGTLTRPSLIFFMPAYFVYLWLSSNRAGNIFKALAVVSLSVILFISLWTIRNYNIHKKFIFITTYSGENFWQGNNQFASGSAMTKDGRSILEAAPKEITEELYKMNEIEQYDFFYRESFKFVKSNPIFFIKMLCKKFFYFWWFSPQTGRLYPRMWTIIYKTYYSALFIFFILGSGLSLNKSNASRALVLPLFVLFFMISSLQSLYYVEMRHRWAIEPLMIVFSAYGFMELFKISVNSFAALITFSLGKYLR